MFAESLPTHCDIYEQETTSTDVRNSTEKAGSNMGKQEGSDSTQPPGPSAPKIEVLEIGTSDSEEEIDQLQLTHSTARTEVDFDTQTGTQHTGEGDADADHEDNLLSVDKVEVRSAPQGSPPRRPSRLAVTPVIQPNGQDTDGVPIHCFTQSPVRPGSRSPLYSLFSDALEDECTVSSHTPTLPIGRTQDKVQEKASPARVPRHDSEAWKEPSFLARNKGKGKARAGEELDTPSVKVGKKRRRSAQPESPVPKQAKISAPEVCRVASSKNTTGTMQPRGTEASANGKIHSSDRPSTSPTDTTEMTTPSTAFQLSKPRLANLVVDFERIDLGKRVPIPMMDMDKDIKSMLLRTGRIRTLGKKVEKNGNVYIMGR